MPELPTKSYEAARAEIVVRIQLRDHVLLSYIVAAGAILGIALKERESHGIALAIPFLSLGATVLVSQHNALIGYLGRFCATEIAAFWRSHGGSGIAQWDTSLSLKEYSRRSILLRTGGNFIVLLTPSVLALTIAWSERGSSTSYNLTWTLALYSLIASIAVVVVAHRVRRQTYNEREWTSAAQDAPVRAPTANFE